MHVTSGFKINATRLSHVTSNLKNDQLRFKLVLVYNFIMAQCNRCGASLSSSTTRALKVHRIHCRKNVPMRFKDPASRVSNHVDESQVIFGVVIQTFEQLIINQ
jgi:hypothetical protein